MRVGVGSWYFACHWKRLAFRSVCFSRLRWWLELETSFFRLLGIRLISSHRRPAVGTSLARPSPPTAGEPGSRINVRGMSQWNQLGKSPCETNLYNDVDLRPRFCSFDFWGAEARRHAPSRSRTMYAMYGTDCEKTKCERLQFLMEPLLQQLRCDAVNRNRGR